ncbi:DUF5712 family protein (plasmid) [Fibrella sp. ES10-3-2-2]
MVVRVLPASKGGIYSNAGSSGFLVTYLEHEARETGQADRNIFFDQHREGIDRDEVQARIDENIRGLQKGKPHFHSLVIAPSQDELRHLDEDPKKLTDYTRQVMENYAANFQNKRYKPLTSDGLVWYATIHRSRHYSGLDDAVQTGEAQARQRKEGEQTHVHVIVSARDQSLSRSLHPDAGSSRFNYKTWLAKNQQDFERTYGYKTIISEAQHRERLDKLIDRIDRAGIALDRERIHLVGRQYNYSSPFWKGMGQVEREVRQGKLFTANQAYERLRETVEPKPKQTQNRAGEERGVRTYTAAEQRGTDRKAGTSDSPIRPALLAGKENTEDNPRENIVKVAQAEAKAPDKNSIGVTSQNDKPGRVDLGLLLKALRFESVPETGDQARSQDDEYRRRLKRRR